MNTKSIQTKLIFAFSLASIVTILVAGLLGLTVLGKTIKDEIHRKLILYSETKEGQMYNYFEMLEARVSDFSSDLFIIDNAKKIIESGPGSGGSELNTYLSANKKILDPDIAGIMVMDLNGNVISSTHENEIGQNESGDEYFIKGINGSYVGNIENEEHFGSDNLFMSSAPLYASGDKIGVITVGFEINGLKKTLSGELQIQEGAPISILGGAEGVEVSLFDLNRNVLVYSNVTGDQKYLGIEGGSVSLPLAKCLYGKEEIIGEYVNQFGEDAIGSSMCISSKGLVLVSEIRKDEAFRSLNGAVYGIEVMLFVAFLFVISNIFIISKKITDPIKKLQEGVEIMGTGDLKHRVSIKTDDEIERLGLAFNRMAERLERSRAELSVYAIDLERKVLEHTKKLAQKVKDLEDQGIASLNIMEDLEKERKEIDEAKAKDDAILSSIGDGVFVIDEDYNIILFNKAAGYISGYSPQEAVGKKYEDILRFTYEKSGKVNSEFIRQSMATGKVVEMSNHTILTRKDGSKIAVADSAAPVMSTDGKIIGCVVVFRDVTQEREIDKAKTEFVSLASHQLRTPLTAVNWYTEMLLGGYAGKPNKKQKSHLKEIYRANGRMVDLVDALLNVSRLELGTFTIEPKQVDIAKLSGSIISEQEQTIKNKKLKFIQKISKKIPLMSADPKLFGMVLQNLLSNSVKYTPEKGTVRLEIGVRKKGEIAMKKVFGEDSLFVMISDTGMGIPEKQKNMIFLKLFRADNVRAADMEGTGLGLYMVKSILDSSGGEVWFESQEGKGSTFCFSIPLSGMKKKEGTKRLG